MVEKALYFSVFRLIEFITKAELTNTSRHLIINYFQEAAEVNASGRARAAVIRYSQCKTLPALEDIRRKTADELSKLEHMVLKMEFEAQKIDG